GGVDAIVPVKVNVAEAAPPLLGSGRSEKIPQVLCQFCDHRKESVMLAPIAPPFAQGLSNRDRRHWRRIHRKDGTLACSPGFSFVYACGRPARSAGAATRPRSAAFYFSWKNSASPRARNGKLSISRRKSRRAFAGRTAALRASVIFPFCTPRQR